MATKRRVLDALSRDELRAAADRLGLPVRDGSRKGLIETLNASRKARVDDVLRVLSSSRLREVRRQLEFDRGGTDTTPLTRRLTAGSDVERRGRLLLGIIVGAVVVVYAQTLAFDFVTFDDDKLILRNHAFLSDPGNVPRAFQRDVFAGRSAGYRPLLTVSLMLDTWIGGQAPFGYHLSNIALHAVGAVCVFFFLVSSGYARGPSGFAAILFAVHPLLVSAVAWVPGRNDSLLAVFAITSWMAFLTYFSGRSRRAHAAHIMLFALALFSKETALALPLLATIYLGLLRREHLLSRRTLNLAIGWIGTVTVWFTLRTSALSQSRPTAVSAGALLGNARAVVEMLGGIAFPFRLSVYPTFSIGATAIGIVTLAIGFGAVVFVPRVRRAYVLFGMTWFCALIGPTLAFRETFAGFDYLNHRIYLPLVGVAIVALELTRAVDLSRVGRPVALTASLVAVVLAGVTVWQARKFRDSVTFWSAAVAESPHSADARYSLGWVLQLRGDLAGAEAAYRRAIELQPMDPVDSPKYYLNLAGIYELRGMRSDATRTYEQAIAISPNYALAHLNLAVIRQREGRLQDAEKEYVEATRLDSTLMLPYANLCTIRTQQDRLEEAERLCRKALDMEPTANGPLIELARVLYSEHRYGEALMYVDQLRARGIAVGQIMPEVVEGLQPHRR